MIIDNLTDEDIYRYIPNVLTEVDGETKLAVKLVPFIATAKQRLERELVGNLELNYSDNELAMKIVVTEAFIDAIPSLDLILTPTGFGVVNTDNVAPASKDRVDRLIASLRDSAKAQRAALFKRLRTYFYRSSWGSSAVGMRLTSTFLSDLNGVRISDTEVMSFEEAIKWAGAYEEQMAQNYLGKSLMASIRSNFHFPWSSSSISSTDENIIKLIVTLEEQLIRNRVAPSECSDIHLWPTMKKVINIIKGNTSYNSTWQREMGSTFIPEDFVNDIKGGFYF